MSIFLDYLGTFSVSYVTECVFNYSSIRIQGFNTILQPVETSTYRLSHSCKWSGCPVLCTGSDNLQLSLAFYQQIYLSHL